MGAYQRLQPRTRGGQNTKDPNSNEGPPRLPIKIGNSWAVGMSSGATEGGRRPERKTGLADTGSLPAESTQE